MGNVVIRRDLPTGKGERPSSHTPEPEDVNRGRGRSPGIRPGKNPANEDRHELSPFHQEKEGGYRPERARFPSTGGRSRGRGGFERLSFDGNDGRGNPREDPKDALRGVERETALGEPHTHRYNRGVRRDFGHLSGEGVRGRVAGGRPLAKFLWKHPRESVFTALPG